MANSVIVRLLVIGVSVYMIITLSSLWSTLNDKNKELASLNAEVEAVEHDIEKCKALLDESSTDEIIEKAARERLGYVYSGEEVYIDISGN